MVHDKVLLMIVAVAFVSILQVFFVGGVSNITRKYTPQSFAVYKPAMNFMTDGALEIWFKTEQQSTMIFYQDTGGQGEFIDVFLVNGKARMRLAIGDCSITNRIINGSFNDLKWHKVKITRQGFNTTFFVDNLHALPVRCTLQMLPMIALYTGQLSIDIVSLDKEWALPSIFFDSGFQGCISEIQYIIEGKVIIPKLHRTKFTVPGCTNPCDKFKCKNGGKCIDRIFKPWCDCEGTGYEGKRCGKALPKDSSTSSRLFTSSPSQFSTVRPNIEVPMTSSVTASSSKLGGANAKQARKNGSGLSHGGCVYLFTLVTIVCQIVISNGKTWV